MLTNRSNGACTRSGVCECGKVLTVDPAESRFADLYERYHRFVASYCARRLAWDRVEDAVAETFLVVWRRLDDVPEGDTALRWLYGVAYKVVGRQWRTTSRSGRLEGKLRSLGVDAVPIPEDVVLVSSESQQVLEALKRLNSLDQEILLLAAWEELRHQEIAEILDLRPDAVRQRFHKAKQRLTDEFNRSETRTAATPAAAAHLCSLSIVSHGSLALVSGVFGCRSFRRGEPWSQDRGVGVAPFCSLLWWHGEEAPV